VSAKDCFSAEEVVADDSEDTAAREGCVTAVGV